MKELIALLTSMTRVILLLCLFAYSCLLAVPVPPIGPNEDIMLWVQKAIKIQNTAVQKVQEQINIEVQRLKTGVELVYKSPDLKERLKKFGKDTVLSSTYVSGVTDRINELSPELNSLISKVNSTKSAFSKLESLGAELRTNINMGAFTGRFDALREDLFTSVTNSSGGSASSSVTGISRQLNPLEASSLNGAAVSMQAVDTLKLMSAYDSKVQQVAALAADISTQGGNEFSNVVTLRKDIDMHKAEIINSKVQVDRNLVKTELMYQEVFNASLEAKRRMREDQAHLESLDI